MMQSLSAEALQRPRISLTGAGPYDRAARAVTSRREYGRNGSARAAIPHHGGHLLQKSLGAEQACGSATYCGEATQTATSGVFEALGTGPQEALRSLRNCA
jgi:hypothetical protein